MSDFDQHPQRRENTLAIATFTVCSHGTTVGLVTTVGQHTEEILTACMGTDTNSPTAKASTAVS